MYPVNTYFCELTGGIGDALLTYLHTPVLRKLPLMKACVPDLEVHIYSQVHNNGIEDLFWYHPVVTRHLQIVQLPQFTSYEGFDQSLVPPHLKSCISLDCSEFPDHEPVFNLSDFEQKRLDKLIGMPQPLIVIQPFAGLPDRDAFDSASLKKFVSGLPGTKIIIGSNAPRVCSDRSQRVDFEDPSVINLIDALGIRLTYHLIQRCDAFIGCHSSIVLLAWYHNKPTVCILPMPFLSDKWEALDPKYKAGVGRENTLITSFTTHGSNWPEDFEFSSLECSRIIEFLNQWIR